MSALSSQSHLAAAESLRDLALGSLVLALRLEGLNALEAERRAMRMAQDPLLVSWLQSLCIVDNFAVADAVLQASEAASAAVWIALPDRSQDYTSVVMQARALSRCNVSLVQQNRMQEALYAVGAIVHSAQELLKRRCDVEEELASEVQRAEH